MKSEGIVSKLCDKKVKAIATVSDNSFAIIFEFEKDGQILSGLMLHKLDSPLQATETIELVTEYDKTFTRMVASKNYLFVVCDVPALNVFDLASDPEKHLLSVDLNESYPAPLEVAVYQESHCLCLQVNQNG